MSKIADFFKKIEHVFERIWHGVEKVIPDEQLIAGIEYVEHAAVAFVENSQRRQWVIEQLMKRFPIGENIARLIVELALFQVKKGIEKGTGALETEVLKP